MLQSSIPVLGFAAASGTGKTTLLTQLLPLLKQQGWQIGLIKHSHHNFEMDKPGKDSFRLRAAGASPVLLVSAYRQVVITEFNEPKEPQLAEQLQAFEKSGVDLILVEGFKHECFPKIELHRQELAQPLLYPTDRNIIAVASNVQLPLPEPLLLLDLDNPEVIAQFIQTKFLLKSL